MPLEQIQLVWISMGINKLSFSEQAIPLMREELTIE